MQRRSAMGPESHRERGRGAPRTTPNEETEGSERIGYDQPIGFLVRERACVFRF